MDVAKKEAMLKIVVDYLRKTPPWLLLVHLVYIAAIAAVLSVSYVVSFHWQSLVKIYEEAHSIENFSANLKTSVEAQNQINFGLGKALSDLSGMRAYVYRYHNGLAAISGVPFFFQSNTNEVISPGTSRLMQFEQRIPVGIHMAINMAFVENRCAIVRNADKNRNDQNYYFWQTRGARSVVRCPIYMPNGDLFGFVGMDFIGDMQDERMVVDRLTALSKEFATLYAASRP